VAEKLRKAIEEMPLRIAAGMPGRNRITLPKLNAVELHPV
jgi:hypothetical protein